MAVDIGTAVAYLNLDTTNFNQSLSAVQDAIKTFADNTSGLGDRISSVGQIFSNVGASMTKNLTLPLADLAKSAVDNYRTYESALTGVRKTMDDTAVAAAGGYEVLEKGAEEIAFSTASTVESVLGVMEVAGQLGIQLGENGQDLMEFTKVMIMLGDSTDVSAEEAATALAKFMNVAGTTEKDTMRLGSTIVDLGNNFATSESDIIHMAQRLVSAGTTAGLTETDILALATAMSSVGIAAERGGSSMSQTLAQIEKIVAGVAENSGEKLEMLGQISGMTADEFAYKWKNDPMEALKAFLFGLGEVQDAGGSLVVSLDELGMSGIRQSDMLRLLALSSDNLSGAIDVANTAWQENTALTTEAEKRYETLDSQINQLNEKWKSMKRDIAEILIPVLKDLMDVLENLINWWKGLSEEQQKNIVKIAAIIAAIGPLLSIFGKILTSVGQVISIFQALTKSTSTVATTSAKAALSFAQLAGQALQLAALAVVILAVAEAIKMLVSSAIELYSAGPGAIATFAGLTAAAILMTAAIAAIGSACTATAPGLLALGAAVLMVSAGIAAITAAIALVIEALADLVTAFVPLADKLPIISEYGLSAAAAITALGLACTVAAVPILLMEANLALFSITAGIATPVIVLLSGAIEMLSLSITSLSLAMELCANATEVTWGVISTVISEAVQAIARWIEGLVDGIISAFKKLKYELIGDPIVLDIVDGVKRAFWDMVENVVQFIKDLVKDVIDGFKQMFNDVKIWLGHIKDRVSEFIKNVIRDVGDFFKDIIKAVGDKLSEIFGDIKDWFNDLCKKIGDWLSDAYDIVSGWFKDLPGDMLQWGKDIITGLWDGLKNVWNNLTTWVNEKFDWFKDKVRDIKDAANGIRNTISGYWNGSHANGLDYVPFDGYVAQLHEGERVLTKSEAKDYNDNKGTGSGDTFNFYNTKPDPYEYARQMKNAKRELAF